jgi:hypothetical protein
MIKKIALPTIDSLAQTLRRLVQIGSIQAVQES